MKKVTNPPRTSRETGAALGDPEEAVDAPAADVVALLTGQPSDEHRSGISVRAVEPEEGQPVTREIGNCTFFGRRRAAGRRRGAHGRVGTAAWLVAFVALLPFCLEDSGNQWWLWTCPAGFGLGLLGLEFCRRRRKARAEGREPAV